MNKILENLIKGIAPVLGTALGGPLGGLAATTLSQVVLGKDNGSEKEILYKLEEGFGISNEMELKLKDADHQFKLKLEQIGIDVQKMMLDDVNNARTREVELAKINSDNKYTLAFSYLVMPLLAVLITLGFFGCMMLIAFLNIDKEAAQILNILSGILGTCFVQIISYYFGSSLGSKLKDK